MILLFVGLSFVNVLLNALDHVFSSRESQIGS
jgi:hypothetical protein